MARTKSSKYAYVAVVNGKEVYFTSYDDGAEKLGISRNVLAANANKRSFSLEKKGILLRKLEECPVREHRIVTNEEDRRGLPKKRKVYMLDPYTHEILDEYDSAVEAVKDLNEKSPSIISKCCRGLVGTAYGFKWEYADLTATS